MQNYEEKTNKPNNSQSNFDYYEDRERKYIEEVSESFSNMLFIRKINPKGTYAPYDCTLLSAGTHTVLITEVKIRDFGINKYDDAILEQAKCKKVMKETEKMIKIANENGFFIYAYYMAVYPTSKRAALWPITGNEQTKEMWCNKKTAESRTNKTSKTVCLFPINQAEIIKY